MGFGERHLFFGCGIMKFSFVLFYLLLLFHSPQGSTIPHKRSIRALNTTLQTNFNGTYQRRNPCTDAEVETSSYVASHEFRHHTKEDNWKDYAHKCSQIISSFLRAIGDLVRFNSKQSGCFNFHINTFISQKQDAVCENGKQKPCASLPTIKIEATDCEMSPAVEKVEENGGEIEGRKYPISQQSVKIKKAPPCTGSPETPAVQKKFPTSPDEKFLSETATANYDTELKSQKTEAGGVQKDSCSFTPTAVQTVTPASFTESKKFSPEVLTDIGLNIQTTFEPEQLSDFSKTSIEQDFQQEIANPVTLTPENEFKTADYNPSSETPKSDLTYSEESEEFSVPKPEKLMEATTGNPPFYYTTETTIFETVSPTEIQPTQQQSQPLVSQQELENLKQQLDDGLDEAPYSVLVDQQQTDSFTSPERVPAVTLPSTQGEAFSQHKTPKEESLAYPEQIPPVLEQTAKPQVTVSEKKIISDESFFEEPQPAYLTTLSGIQPVEVGAISLATGQPDSFLNASPQFQSTPTEFYPNQPENTTPYSPTSKFDESFDQGLPLKPAENDFSPDYRVLEYSTNYPVPTARIQPGKASTTTPPDYYPETPAQLKITPAPYYSTELPGFADNTAEIVITPVSKVEQPSVVFSDERSQTDATALTSRVPAAGKISSEQLKTVSDYRSIADKIVNEKQPVVLPIVVSPKVVPAVANRVSYFSDDRTTTPSAAEPILSSASVRPVQPLLDFTIPVYPEQQTTTIPPPASAVTPDYFTPVQLPVTEPVPQSSVDYSSQYPNNGRTENQSTPNIDEQWVSTSQKNQLPSTRTVPTYDYPTTPAPEFPEYSEQPYTISPFETTTSIAYKDETSQPSSRSHVFNDETTPIPTAFDQPNTPVIISLEEQRSEEYKSDSFGNIGPPKLTYTPTTEQPDNLQSTPSTQQEIFESKKPFVDDYQSPFYLSPDPSEPQPDITPAETYPSQPNYSTVVTSQYSDVNSVPDYLNHSFTTISPTTETYTESTYTEIQTDSFSPKKDKSSKIERQQEQQSGEFLPIDEFPQENPSPRPFLPYSNELRGRQPSTTLSPYSSPAAAVAYFQQSPKADIQSESLTAYTDSNSQEFPTRAIPPESLAVDSPITPAELQESVQTESEQSTAMFSRDSTISPTSEQTFKPPTPSPLIYFPEQKLQPFPKPVSSRPKPVAFEPTAFTPPPSQSTSAVYDQQTTSEFFPEQQPENFTPEPLILIQTKNDNDAAVAIQPESEVVEKKQLADNPSIVAYLTTSPEVPEYGTTFLPEPQPTTFSENVEVSSEYQPTAAVPVQNFNAGESAVTPAAVDQQSTLSTDYSFSQPALDQTFSDSTQRQVFDQAQANSEVYEPPSRISTGGNGQPLSVEFQPSFVPESQTETTLSYSDERKPYFPVSMQTPLELPSETISSSSTENRSTTIDEFQIEDSTLDPNIRSSSPASDYSQTTISSAEGITQPLFPAVGNLILQKPETALNQVQQQVDASPPSQPFQTYNQFPMTTSYKKTVTASDYPSLPTSSQLSDYYNEETTTTTDINSKSTPSPSVFALETQVNPFPTIPKTTVDYSDTVKEETTQVDQENFEYVQDTQFQSPSLAPELQPQPSPDYLAEIPGDKPTTGATQNSTTLQIIQLKPEMLVTSNPNSGTAFQLDGQMTDSFSQNTFATETDFQPSQPQQRSNIYLPTSTASYSEFEERPGAAVTENPVTDISTPRGTSLPPKISYSTQLAPIRETSETQSIQETSELIDEALPQLQPASAVKRYGETVTADYQSPPATKPEPQTALNYPNPLSDGNVANVSPDQQYPMSTPKHEIVTYDQFSQTRNNFSDSKQSSQSAAVTVTTPNTPYRHPVAPQTTKVVQTYEQDIFTSDSPKQLSSKNYQSQVQFNNNRQQDPFHYNLPATYPNSTSYRPQFVPDTVVYGQETARRLPQYTNNDAVAHQKFQGPPAFNYPQHVPNFNERFPREFGRNFDSREPIMPYDQSQQQNYRMNNENIPAGRFATRRDYPNQFNEYYSGGQPNGPARNSYNPSGDFNRYRPTPQEVYDYQGRNYDDRNIPSDSFVGNRHSFGQTRTFDDAGRPPSDYQPRMTQGRPPYFEPYTDTRHQMYQQQSRPFMASPQMQPSAFSNHPNFTPRELSSDFGPQSQFLPSYSDNNRRGFSPEGPRNFEQPRPLTTPQIHEFHSQAAALPQPQPSSFPSYSGNSGRSSEFHLSFQPQTQSYSNTRELRSDISEQQSRPFPHPPRAQSFAFNTRELSPNFQPQTAALTQSFESYSDRREFSSDMPAAPRRDFKTPQTHSDTKGQQIATSQTPFTFSDNRTLQSETLHKQEQQNQSESLVLYNGKSSPETKTKIVEEIITTDFPTALTVSPVEAQLAYVDRLLNNDKAKNISPMPASVEKRYETSSQSVRLPDQRQYFRSNGQQVETSYEGPYAPKRLEQSPQRLEPAGSFVPDQSLSGNSGFDERQQELTPFQQQQQFPAEPLRTADTHVNIPAREYLRQPTSFEHPNQNGHDRERNFVPPQRFGAATVPLQQPQPQPISHGLVSDQTAPSNKPDRTTTRRFDFMSSPLRNPFYEDGRSVSTPDTF